MAGDDSSASLLQQTGKGELTYPSPLLAQTQTHADARTYTH